MKTKTLIRSLSLFSVIALPSCSGLVGQDKLSAPEEIHLSKLDVNLYPVTNLVCDPMGGDTDPRSNAGLKAELYWLPASVPVAHSTSDLIARGTKSTHDLFFHQLNVPTRAFTDGFATDTGGAVKTDSGDVLIENFAIRFSSVLRLAPTQDEGLYEFAVLSDDGTVVRLRDDDGVYKPIIESDGDHETRMGCSTQTLNMKHDTEKLMQLDYYQGPRYHIALAMLMRKVTDADANGNFAADPLCGHASNTDWYDLNNGSVPLKNYTDLIARGWQLLTSDNFAIPNTAVFNPCMDGVIPVLSNAVLGERFSTQVSMDWDTDIASTTQLVVIDAKTGAQKVSVSDNVLSTHHHALVDGLTPDTDYFVEGVSISDSYGKGMSDLLNYHTTF